MQNFEVDQQHAQKLKITLREYGYKLMAQFDHEEFWKHPDYEGYIHLNRVAAKRAVPVLQPS